MASKHDSVANKDTIAPVHNKEKLFSTEAYERPEAVNAKNELKEFVGGKGTPRGPFGKKGKNF